MFQFLRPIVIITDPKLVKHLAVKDFESFQDHRGVITEDIDPILGSMLTALTGQKWKGGVSFENLSIFVKFNFYQI
jgi:cytochrome P450 family 9